MQSHTPSPPTLTTSFRTHHVSHSNRINFSSKMEGWWRNIFLSGAGHLRSESSEVIFVAWNSEHASRVLESILLFGLMKQGLEGRVVQIADRDDEPLLHLADVYRKVALRDIRRRRRPLLVPERLLKDVLHAYNSCQANSHGQAFLSSSRQVFVVWGYVWRDTRHL